MKDAWVFKRAGVHYQVYRGERRWWWRRLQPSPSKWLSYDSVDRAELDDVKRYACSGGGRTGGGQGHASDHPEDNPEAKIYIVVHRPADLCSAGPLAVMATNEEAERAIAELDDTGGFPAADLDVEGWPVGEILRAGPEDD